jgi:hypothetical protein
VTDTEGTKLDKTTIRVANYAKKGSEFHEEKHIALYITF